MATMSDLDMVAAAQLWRGKPESSHGGGRQRSANRMAWATSDGRKKPAQGSRAAGAGSVAAAGGGSKDIDAFQSYDFSTLLWAFAKLHGNEGLPPSAQRIFFAAANQTSKELQTFSFRSRANIAWAYATDGVRRFHLFSNISRQMIRTVESANCQGIANTIWAFTNTGHDDVRFFTVLAEAAMPIMNDFKAQELSSMLWGLAICGFVNEDSVKTEVVSDDSDSILSLDSVKSEVVSDDSDSILSLEPGEFDYECRLPSVDSLENFPNTPEDSDDEYCKALVAQQTNKDGLGMMPMVVLQPYAFQM
jgi:hypothetical protein